MMPEEKEQTVDQPQAPEAAPERSDRYETLRELEDWLEEPVEWLGLVWLVLLVIEVLWGLNPILDVLFYVIWGIFLLDFGLRLLLAPQRAAFLRHNWLTVLSLLVPALRVLAVFRAARLVRLLRGLRGARLVRIVGTLNRGMRALRSFLGRRKFGYVVALTLLVTVGGAVGMWSFEQAAVVAGGFTDFGDALWWTAMLMTTVGSDYWPQTPEGRTLTVLLALYAFSVFGYLTASLASFFIGREADSPGSGIAGQATLGSLEARLGALQADVQRLSPRGAEADPGAGQGPPAPGAPG
jgi:voltage-gated potassium channel